jgi:hypothetical protein
MKENIKPADGKKVLRVSNGRTVDIQSVIFEVNKDGIWRDTKEFSKQYKPTRESLGELWQFVKSNIRYREDPDGVQWVKDPARLWQDKEGDCKSFTLFIVSILQNMGIPYTIRFTAYRKGTVTHVYPIAHLPNGKDVILDAVWYAFDSEKAFHHKQDFKFQKKMADIYRLSGMNDIQSITSDIHPSVLDNDITKMTDSEFYQFLGYNKVSGIGKAFETRMAFTAPTLNFEISTVNGVGKVKIKDVVKKVGTAIKEAWSKLVNWIFKGAIQKAAPFFLYTFLKKDVSAKISAKRDKQNGILNFLSKAMGTDRAKFDAAIRAEIVKKTGKHPEQLLNEAAKSKVSGVIGLLDDIKTGLDILLQIIDKVKSLFKKKTTETPVPDEKSASDLGELETEAKSENVTQPAGNDSDAGKVVIKTPVEPENTEGVETADNKAPIIPVIVKKNDSAKEPSPEKDDNNTVMIALAAVVVAGYVLMN